MNIESSLSTRRNLASFRRFVEAQLETRNPWNVVDPASPLGLSAGQKWQARIEHMYGVTMDGKDLTA